MLFAAAIFIYILLNIIDIATAYVGLSLGLTELNPIFSFGGKWIFFIASTAVFIIFRRYFFARIILYIMTIISAVVALNNIYLLGSLL